MLNEAITLENGCAGDPAAERRLQRGEVWWAHIDQVRPVVILSQDETCELRAMVIVAPADSDIRGIAVEVNVGAEAGLPDPGVLRVALPQPGHILCNWLVSLRPVDLIERTGVLTAAQLAHLEYVLRLGGLA